MTGRGHFLHVPLATSGEHASSVARFDALYRVHHRAVLGYALRRTDPDTAPDIVSETFLVAWRRLDAVPDDALPWLLGVARRTLSNQRRTARRADALGRRLRTIRPTEVDPPTIEDDAVLHAFGSLSAADREVLSLVAWEGLTTSQIAKVLGTTAVAARVRLHRARRRLAAALELLETNRFAQSRPSHSPVAKESA